MAKNDTPPIKVLLDVAIFVAIPVGTNIDNITQQVRSNVATLLLTQLKDPHEAAFKVAETRVEHVGTVLGSAGDITPAIAYDDKGDA